MKSPRLTTALARDLAHAHPERAAAVLESASVDEIGELLSRYDAESAARLVRYMTAHHATLALGRMTTEASAKVFAHLPVELATTLLRRTSADVRAEILGKLPAATSQTFGATLGFPENSVGAVMDPLVLAVSHDLTVREALAQIRSSAAYARYNVYVVDREGTLVGAVNLRELLIARPRHQVSAVMTGDPARLLATAPLMVILEHPGWRTVHALPVVDAVGRYLGAVRYRTLRRLEADLRGKKVEETETDAALGELLSASASAFFEALGSSPRRRES